MRPEELDRILSRWEPILPSPGFADSVMRAVRREASAPGPIPFPWKRALPGFAVAVILIARVLAEIARAAIRGAPAPAPMAPILVSLLETARALRADWILVASLLTLASLAFVRRLVRRTI